MTGLRDREVAIVDKDGDLAGTATSQPYGPPGEAVAREWTTISWWLLSDVAEYLERGSLFSTAERIALLRQEALKLYAAARDLPKPGFGLTSLLEYEPFEVPRRLTETYPVPSDHNSVAACRHRGRRPPGSASKRRSTSNTLDLSTMLKVRSDRTPTRQP
jgi:hypothetical protein